MHAFTAAGSPCSGLIYDTHISHPKSSTVCPTGLASRRRMSLKSSYCSQYKGRANYLSISTVLKRRKHCNKVWGFQGDSKPISSVSESKSSTKSCPDPDPDLNSTFDHKQWEQSPNRLISRFLEGLSGSIKSPLEKFKPDGFAQELTSIAVPAIAEQAIQPMAQLMETAYIGRLGSVSLGAVAVAFQIFNLITKLFNIPLLNVTASFVAEDASNLSKNKACSGDSNSLNGSSRDDCFSEFEKQYLPAISTALTVATGLGIAEALALSFCGGTFLTAMGIPVASPMRLAAEQYLAIRALGAPAVALSLAAQGVFRGLKNTRTSLCASGAANVLNALLFPLCIVSLKFGVAGAAMATVISHYFMTFLLLWNLNKKVALLPQKLEDLKLGRYLKSGGFLFGRTVAVTMTTTIATAMAARQGSVIMAGHQICIQVWLAVSLLTDALAVAGQALIATAYTNKDYNRVKKVAGSVVKIGLFAGLALVLILYSSLGVIARVFTRDPAVLDTVKRGTLFVAGSQPINALAFVFDGLHYGVSDFAYAACSMMIVGTISSIFLYKAPSYLGIAGVWTGLVLFMFLRATTGIMRLIDENGPWWFLRNDVGKSETALVE